MKISSLFDLVEDAKDVLSYFEGVENREQMVSVLERLKRQDNPETLLDCLFSLSASINRAMNDTLEMSAVLDDVEENDDQDLQSELDKIADFMSKDEQKTQNASAENTDTDTKNSVQT